MTSRSNSRALPLLSQSVFSIILAGALFGSRWVQAAPQQPEVTIYQQPGGPLIVGHSMRNDVSRPLRDIKPGPQKHWTTIREMPEPEGEIEMEGSERGEQEVGNPAQPLQFSIQAPGEAPTLGVSFEGIGNLDGVLPPDTNGDVGPN